MKKFLSKLSIVGLFALLPFGGAFAGAGNNHAAVFVGATDGYHGTDFTLGLEYEYLLPVMEKQLGIGLVGEGIFGSPKALVYVAGLVYHPKQVPGLKMNLSFGGESTNNFDHNESVIRVGAGYDLHYKNFSYGPVYNYDTIGSHTAHVFGIAVGLGF